MFLSHSSFLLLSLLLFRLRKCLFLNTSLLIKNRKRKIYNDVFLSRRALGKDRSYERDRRFFRQVFGSRLLFGFGCRLWRGSWTMSTSNLNCSRRIFLINFLIIGWTLGMQLAKVLHHPSSELFDWGRRSAITRSQTFHIYRSNWHFFDLLLKYNRYNS